MTCTEATRSWRDRWGSGLRRTIQWLPRWFLWRIGFVRVRSSFDMDEITGTTIALSRSRQYMAVRVGNCDYYWDALTGRYDGSGVLVSCPDSTPGDMT